MGCSDKNLNGTVNKLCTYMCIYVRTLSALFTCTYIAIVCEFRIYIVTSMLLLSLDMLDRQM